MHLGGKSDKGWKDRECLLLLIGPKQILTSTSLFFLSQPDRPNDSCHRTKRFVPRKDMSSDLIQGLHDVILHDVRVNVPDRSAGYSTKFLGSSIQGREFLCMFTGWFQRTFHHEAQPNAMSIYLLSLTRTIVKYRPTKPPRVGLQSPTDPSFPHAVPHGHPGTPSPSSSPFAIATS